MATETGILARCCVTTCSGVKALFITETYICILDMHEHIAEHQIIHYCKDLNTRTYCFHLIAIRYHLGGREVCSVGVP